MSQESVRPINPVPEEFAGDSGARSCKRLFHATRPKFFPASVLPVLAGTAWGAHVSGAFDAYVFMLALLATVCVHAASNVLNDVGDETIGTDRINEQRIYPYTGGSRFIQMGILSQSLMARLGVGLLGIAMLLGIALFVERGPVVLLFGLAGIALGVLYSLGPVKLSSLGIGEIAVAVAFGVLPVTGAAWLQGALIDTALILYSLPVSAWVFAILFINEVPDMEADGSTGKNTLPVRLGLSGAASLYLAVNVAAVLVVAYLAMQGQLPIIAPLVPLALLLLAWRATRAIRGGIANRAAMTQAIESTLGIHTIGCLWLTACVVYSIVF
ncbi:MAG: 1,4-dihydroxy-2-naphthoate octaprenyltransferase [Gammaproteobacteria bacterium]|nr:1,4-dihydroxy-2-naphthoate octaprenyltransferase [Gammaproteobacteria bacterium]